MTAFLEPLELAERARTLDQEAFSACFFGDKLLLIRLDENGVFNESLRRALIECPTDRGYTWMPRTEATHTATAIQKMTREDLEALENRALSRPDSPESLARVLQAPHYALPLRKRKESTAGDAERISVGRSHSCDIVLFHPTVSKLHAWLEHDESERLFVSDAGSMNFTRVRSRMLEPENVLNIGYCEEIAFGQVLVRICTAEQLWDAANLGRRG